jgi:hypothetical protein
MLARVLTPRSPRTDTDGFRNRSCSSYCSSTSYVRRSRAGAVEAPVGGRQLGGGECGQSKPHSARAVSGSGRGPSQRAGVSGGIRTAEPGGRTGARARPGVNHRSRFHLSHQGRYPGAAGVLRQLSGGQCQLRDCGSAGHGRDRARTCTLSKTVGSMMSVNAPCHSPKLDRARLELPEALRYQSHSRISGSSQRSISMEWC